MSIKVLLGLWIIAGSLLAAVISLRSQQYERVSETELVEGENLLRGISSELVSRVDIKTHSGSLSFRKKGGQWVAPNRGDFPIQVDQLQRYIGTFFQAKVAQPIKASEKYHKRFGVEDDSQNVSSLRFDLLDENNKMLESIYIGDILRDSSTLAMGGGGAPLGRRVRLGSEMNAIYTLKDTLSSFPDSMTSWLKKDFLSLNVSLKKIGLSQGGSSQWNLEKGNENQWIVSNIPSGHIVDMENIQSIERAISNLSFSDVHGQVTLENYLTENNRKKEDKNEVIVESEAGFQYILSFVPSSVENPEGEQLLSFKIVTNFAETRVKVEGENPEEVAKAEKLFQDTLRQKKEQFQRESKLAKFLYKVDYSSLESLLLKKEELWKAPEEQEERDKASPASLVVPE